MKLFLVTLVLGFSLFSFSALAQEEELMESGEREPARIQLPEAEIRRMAREKSYPGGFEEETLEVQDHLVAPQPEKTIKQLQAEFFEE